ncbi:MAG TPA: hypothetical protein VMY69_00895 [Phycisphaerae bacterium]|nr:hypothetical protein [Phycisphaerae bacterium]
MKKTAVLALGAMRVYPGRRDSLGVSLRAQGLDAVLERLDAWQRQGIW